MVRHLLKEEWRTEQVFDSVNDNQVVELRGFFGSYTLQLKQGDNILATQDFKLSKGEDREIEIGM